MSELAIDLTGVDKRYRGGMFSKGVHALRGVTMRVDRGAIFGLLGPNGAGKSTLVKILMTVISPTRAAGSVLGAPVGDKSTLARVGYLPEHHKFPDYLTGAQIIDLYGALANVPRAQRRKRAGELLELVGMTRWAGTKVREYSKGMRQRIGIAQSLVNNPDLVVLDEPTDGVDPVGRRDIRTVLTSLKDRGTTVFLNSHLLSELEMVCDRVAIMVKGQVERQGTMDELTQGGQRYEIEVASADPAAVFAGVPGLLSPSGTVRTEAAGPTLRVYSTDADVVQPMIDALRSRGVVIRSVRPIRPSLEDLFMQAVTDPTTGQAFTPGAESTGRRGDMTRANGGGR